MNNHVDSTNTNSNAINNHSGLHIILGKSGTGKSRIINIMHDLAKGKSNSVYMHYSDEPDLRSTTFGSQTIEFIKQYVGISPEKGKSEKADEASVDDDVSSTPSVLLVDSVKDALFTLGGAATSQGISSLLGVEFSRISAFAERNNKCVVAIVNALTSKDEIYSELRERLKGSCTSVVELRGDAVLCERRVRNGNYYDRVNTPLPLINAALSHLASEHDAVSSSYSIFNRWLELSNVTDEVNNNFYISDDQNITDADAISQIAANLALSLNGKV